MEQSPIQPTTDPARPRRPLKAWFDVRGRSVGTWAFALNRLTAIGITAYLFMHLIVLSTLLRGEDGWNTFLTIARSPLFLLLDVVLLFGVIYHALNGTRVALVGMGLAARGHKTLFWILSAIGLVLFLTGAYLIFEI
jgi:succinate dehydrogenase / fumarate reductase cytochrome b subunit